MTVPLPPKTEEIEADPPRAPLIWADKGEDLLASLLPVEVEIYPAVTELSSSDGVVCE